MRLLKRIWQSFSLNIPPWLLSEYGHLRISMTSRLASSCMENIMEYCGVPYGRTLTLYPRDLKYSGVHRAFSEQKTSSQSILTHFIGNGEKRQGLAPACNYSTLYLCKLSDHTNRWFRPAEASRVYNFGPSIVLTSRTSL